MSETKSISRSSQLLHEFSQSVAEVAVPGAELRVGKDLVVKAAGRKAQFRLKPVLHPSRRLLDDPELTGEKPALLLCPHIPAPLAADLAKAGVNHADLNGRLFLHADGFHWDREPKRTTYRAAQAAEADLFAPKTARLIRALLAHRAKESWTQAELVERTQVATGLTSRVLAQLVRERFLEVEEPKTSKRERLHYRLRDFDGLLDRWRAGDAWSRRTLVRQFSVVSSDLLQVAAEVRDQLGADNVVLTQWLAAWLRRPHTVPPVASFYVRESVPLKLSLSREVNSGGNLWLAVPKDEGVFQGTQEAGGFRLACDVQIYLDLIGQGLRGPEAAAELRQWEGFAR